MTPRRLFRLWLVILAFCGLYATLGQLLGFVGNEVVDPLFAGPFAWSALPTVVHVLVAGLLIVALVALAHWFKIDAGLPDRRDQRFFLGLLLALGVFLCINQFGELANVVSRKTDFGTILRAAQAVRAGEDPYAATGNGYFYPPILAFLMGGFTWLSAAAASTVFFSLKLVMMTWVLFACDRLVAGKELPPRLRTVFLVGLVFVAARFWIADLQYGNTNVVMLFLMVAAIDQSMADRPVPAGVALALAFAIKIIPGILVLHFLLRRQWKVLIWFAVGTLVLVLVPWLVLPHSWWPTWTQYLDAGVTGKLGERLAQPDNQSIWGMLNRLFPTAPLDSLRLVWFASGAFMVALASAVTLRTSGTRRPISVIGASLYLLVGLLISPGSWVVHYTATLLPMAILWRILLTAGRPIALWMVFVAANVAFTISGWFRATVAPSIEQSWFVMAAFLLILGLGWWALRPRRGAG